MLFGVLLYYILFVQRIWLAPARKGALLNIFYYYCKQAVALSDVWQRWRHTITPSESSTHWHAVAHESAEIKDLGNILMEIW